MRRGVLQRLLKVYNKCATLMMFWRILRAFGIFLFCIFFEKSSCTTCNRGSNVQSYWMRVQICKFFRRFLGECLIFSNEILFGREILSNSSRRGYNVDCKCSEPYENETQSLNFGPFNDFWHFSSHPFLYKALA